MRMPSRRIERDQKSHQISKNSRNKLTASNFDSPFQIQGPTQYCNYQAAESSSVLPSLVKIIFSLFYHARSFTMTSWLKKSQSFISHTIRIKKSTEILYSKKLQDQRWSRISSQPLINWVGPDVLASRDLEWNPLAIYIWAHGGPLHENPTWSHPSLWTVCSCQKIISPMPIILSKVNVMRAPLIWKTQIR